VNYGGIEESTVDTSAKLKMFAAELKPEFVVINAGFCQIRTTVHNKQDVAQAIDSIMHNLHLMADEAKSRGIIPILSTLPPVRPVYLLPYSGLIGLPSREKPILNEAIQNINAKVKQLARERNLPFVDFHKALADETGLLRKEYSLSDGEHLNWEGYRAMSDFFVRELTPIIQTSGKM
jgi:lysophospholipase L1-like esterase